jgi:hypothetical protein
VLNFSNAPPTDHHRHPIPIIRTPKTGFFEAVCLSEDLLGTHTHFFGGRTIPCSGEDCPACLKISPLRWHGYVCAKALKAATLCVFEFTATASETFIEYRTRYRTLRGCQFRARRRNPTQNSQVVLQATTCEIDPKFLPQAPDLLKLLCQLWRIDPADYAAASSILTPQLHHEPQEPKNPEDPAADQIPTTGQILEGTHHAA